MALKLPNLPGEVNQPKPSGFFGFLKNQIQDLVGDIKGIGTGIKREIQTTSQKQQEAISATIQGQQGTLRGVGQAAGRAALGLSNVVGEVFTGVVKAAIPPQGEQLIKRGLEKFGTGVVAPLVQTTAAQDLLKEYKSLTPASQRDIIAFAGVGSLALDLFPGGKAGAGIIKNAMDSLPDTSKLALKNTNDPATVKNILKETNPAFDILATQTIERIAKETDLELIPKIIQRDLEIQFRLISKVNDKEIAFDKTKFPTTRVGKADLGKISFPASSVVPEAVALKNKLRFASRVSKGAAVATRKSIKELQSEIVDVLKKEIPTDFRFKYLTKLKNANTAEKAEKVLDELISDSSKIAQIELENAVRGNFRSKIAFVKKIGEMNPLVQADVKKQLGIDVPLKSMSKEQLESVYDELKNRLSNMDRAVKVDTTISPEEYLEVSMLNTQIPFSEGFISTTKTVADSTLKKLDQTLGVVSTRLQNIAPEIKGVVRGYVNNTILRKQERLQVLEDVFGVKGKHYKKIEDGDKNILSYSLFNGDFNKAEEVFNNYGLNFTPIKSMLRDTLDEARAVKAFDEKELKLIENYYPRTVKDFDGLMNALGEEEVGAIQKAWASRQGMLGRPLDDFEKSSIANSLLRGFKVGGATVKQAGAFKERTIQKIRPELLRYYDDPLTSLTKYINEVTEKIEWNKLVGKVEPKAMGTYTPESTIGAVVTKLVSEGKIDLNQEQTLNEILTSLVNARGDSGIISIYKNLEYTSLLANIFGVITNFKDLSVVMTKYGVANTFDSFLKSTFGKTDVNLKDLGLEDRVLKEFKDDKSLTRLTKEIFKTSLFTLSEKINNKTLLTAALKSAQKQAQKPSREFLEKMSMYFGDGAGLVLKDLKDGNISWDVKHFLLNEISDLKPISKLEVPEKYLTAGGMRLLYMLRTWSIKQIDVQRREGYGKMAKGAKSGDRELFTEGAWFLTKFATIYSLWGATVDEVKGFVKGEEVDFSEAVWDNAIQMSGLFNQYTMNRSWQQGDLSVLINSFVPPHKLVGNAYKDFSKAIKDIYADGELDFKINEAKSIRSIPVGGDLYYWWFGKHSGERKSGLPDLPGLPSLPGLPDLPDLPI